MKLLDCVQIKGTTIVGHIKEIHQNGLDRPVFIIETALRKEDINVIESLGVKYVPETK